MKLELSVPLFPVHTVYSQCVSAALEIDNDVNLIIYVGANIIRVCGGEMKTEGLLHFCWRFVGVCRFKLLNALSLI